ncbi:hypothetical protein FHR92_000811 [Fontibacillus solani]|uniref:Core-binding (CB) domain-containing protein n=1 Tax=Fontibacillus solani TaxID=1572857 RepID=A0A7W3SQH1_9BACL|nr:N-terminal phage integrase SAM-like domain-containing protein [Fontibacillus solani]MBA9084357.1 hypothetical protein [Fontibacillus solani]
MDPLTGILIHMENSKNKEYLMTDSVAPSSQTTALIHLALNLWNGYKFDLAEGLSLWDQDLLNVAFQAIDLRRGTPFFKPNMLKTTKRLKDFLNEELVKFKIEVEAGEYIAPEKMTFASFIQEWEVKYAQKHLAEKTLYTYRSHLKTRILQTFGHLKLDQIKTIHIVTFLDSLTKDGARLGYRKGNLSTGTIEINHRVLKNVFSRAYEWKLIKKNPLLV